MKSKILKIMVAVLSATLLFGGTALMFRDDAEQVISEYKVQDFAPDSEIKSSFDTVVLNENEISEIIESKTISISIDSEIQEKAIENVQSMQKNYDDSVGWIYIPDTKVNYPVMQSDDNEYYLHRAVDGSCLHAGSVFLDYRCNNDFSEKINVLYGHNLSNGTMFADVKKYLNDEYFDSHRYGWLTVENEIYLIEFIAVSQHKSTDRFYDVSADFTEWREWLRRNSLIWKNDGISEENCFVSLSTCTESKGSSRTVLTGKIIKL